MTSPRGIDSGITAKGVRHEYGIDYKRPAALAIGIVLCVGLFVSCSNTPDEPEYTTIAWKNDGAGYLRFSTNDPSNLGIIHMIPYPSTTATPSVITATVIKKSGHPSPGFGVVFGYSSASGMSCYEVLIDTTGRYIVSKTVKNVSTTVQGWTASPDIVTGYDSANSIAVTYSGSEYHIAFNSGSSAYSFSPDETIGTAGSCGFYARVGTTGQEDFPDDPIDVRFRMTVPTTIPSP